VGRGLAPVQGLGRGLRGAAVMGEGFAQYNARRGVWEEGNGEGRGVWEEGNGEGRGVCYTDGVKPSTVMGKGTSN
jgi:hypothetical protein